MILRQSIVKVPTEVLVSFINCLFPFLTQVDLKLKLMMIIEYRSAIFFHSPEQEQVAKQVTKEVQEKYLKNKPIVTQILPIGKWWAGEEYHQQYRQLIHRMAARRKS